MSVVIIFWHPHQHPFDSMFVCIAVLWHVACVGVTIRTRTLQCWHLIKHPLTLTKSSKRHWDTLTFPVTHALQEQIAREKTVSGRVQLQVWYHGERKELIVSLMAADDLSPRDDSLGHGSLPEAYAKVRISPKT